MDNVFFWLTILIDVLGLATALCLGLYLVTRTPRGWVTWLAALTLWSLACFYLYNILAVTVPGASEIVGCKILPLELGGSKGQIQLSSVMLQENMADDPLGLSQKIFAAYWCNEVEMPPPA